MITKDSNASGFINKCADDKACAEAMVWLRDNYSKDNGITTYNIVDKYLKDNSITSSWGYWAIRTLGSNLDTGIKKLFINKITDSMIAFQLYIKCNHLTDAEESLLKAKFEGKLPTAEKELREGVIVKWQ